jgi:transposase
MDYRYHIGMDAHSKTCTFVAMNRKGRIVKRATVQTREGDLVGFVRSIKGPKALAFEETTISQWLYVLLKDKVDHLVVCDPSANTPRRGAKTDRIDATELADLLRTNRLHPVFHTCDERMQLRTLVSGYEDLVQEMVRAKNRYRSLFRQSAICLSGYGKYSNQKYIKQLSSKQQRFVAKPLLEQLGLMAEHKRQYHKQFSSNLRRYKEMRLIKSIPGFSDVTANQIVAIVVSPWRFSTKYKFFSYAMLVKHGQYSDNAFYGNKRVFGNAQLKTIFKRATWTVLRTSTDNSFKRMYNQRLLQGCSKKTAYHAVTRALAATVLAVWKTEKKYDDHYREVDRQKISCNKRA